MSLSDGFAARSGPRPLTTDVNPHTQLDQNAPAELQDRLRDHALPTLDAERLIELGWAEYHNLVTRGLAPPVVVMIYGPRDEHELAVVKQVVELAYLAAAEPNTQQTVTPSVRLRQPDDPGPPARRPAAAHPGWHDVRRPPPRHLRTEW